MDNEFEESVVLHRTQLCKKIVQTTGKMFHFQECDIMLNMKPKKPQKINWKYDPKLNQDQIFEGEFESMKKNKCKKPEGSNNQSNDSENLLKVTKMMKKMKYLKEVSEIDQTVKEIPEEVLIEELNKRFGVQVS